MGALAWVMMGLALWHFSIWLPDRYWGGIVGAFLGALIGAFLFGFLINGLLDPGPPRHRHRHRAGGDPRRVDRDGRWSISRACAANARPSSTRLGLS